MSVHRVFAAVIPVQQNDNALWIESASGGTDYAIGNKKVEGTLRVYVAE